VKVKEKKSGQKQVPFDPILFALTVPSRKPTAADIKDAKQRIDDAVEPDNHKTMDDAVKDSFSIAPHGGRISFFAAPLVAEYL